MRLVIPRFVTSGASIAVLIAGSSLFMAAHVIASTSVGQDAALAELKLPAELEQVVRVVKPRADETRWRRIPWMTDLAQAQQVAKSEGRPLFVFVSGDDPLEAC